MVRRCAPSAGGPRRGSFDDADDATPTQAVHFHVGRVARRSPRNLTAKLSLREGLDWELAQPGVAHPLADVGASGRQGDHLPTTRCKAGPRGIQTLLPRCFWRPILAMDPSVCTPRPATRAQPRSNDARPCFSPHRRALDREHHQCGREWPGGPASPREHRPLGPLCVGVAT